MLAVSNTIPTKTYVNLVFWAIDDSPQRLRHPTEAHGMGQEMTVETAANALGGALGRGRRFTRGSRSEGFTSHQARTTVGNKRKEGGGSDERHRHGPGARGLVRHEGR